MTTEHIAKVHDALDTLTKAFSEQMKQNVVGINAIHFVTEDNESNSDEMAFRFGDDKKFHMFRNVVCRRENGAWVCK